MIIEIVLLVWCIIVTVLLIFVIHCQNNQSDIIKLLNDDLWYLRESIRLLHKKKE